MKCDACGAPVENGRCTYCGKEFPEVVPSENGDSSTGKSRKKEEKTAEPQKIVIENNYYYSDAPEGKQGGGKQKVQNRPYVKPSRGKALMLWFVAVVLFFEAVILIFGGSLLLFALFSLLLAAMACPLVTKLTWNVPKLQFYYRHKKIIVIIVVILWVLSMGV